MKVKVIATIDQLIDMGIEGVKIDGEEIGNGSIIEVSPIPSRPNEYIFIGDYFDLEDHQWYIGRELFEIVEE